METMTFFRFKMFPQSLKYADQSDWASLQLKLLNPFQDGFSRHYISSKGIHIWYSQTPFDGAPETALQVPMPDGSHVLKSTHFTYHQKWQDAVLIESVCKPHNKNDKSQPIEISDQSAWAIERTLDKKLKSPHVWMGLSGFAFICVLLWAAAGYATTALQTHFAERKSAELSERVGDALAQENQQRTLNAALDGMYAWQSEHGFFPEAYGQIASQLNQLGEWQPNAIRWQNQRFELEFASQAIDIAALVELLEAQPQMSQVSIRPNNADNTWVLEVTVQ